MLTDMDLPFVEIETKIPVRNEKILVRANSIVIVDEIDYILLDLNVTFVSTKSTIPTNISAVIGLTAMQTALLNERQRITTE